MSELCRLCKSERLINCMFVSKSTEIAKNVPPIELQNIQENVPSQALEAFSKIAELRTRADYNMCPNKKFQPQYPGKQHIENIA